MLKKLIALLLSIMMLSSGIPAFAAGNPIVEISRYFDSNLSAQGKTSITLQPQDPDKKKKVLKDAEPAKDDKKKVDPQLDLESYFDDNEEVSARGVILSFNTKQQELAAYIRNSDWRTKKGLSKSDRAFVISLIELGKFALMWTDIVGLDGVLDSLESAVNDKDDNQYAAAKAAFTETFNMLEAMDGEDLSVDKLYAKIQHNAFYLVIIDGESFKKVSAKYPEVAYLFDDLYTFFRWRYEMRARVPGYELNEDNINVIFRTATYINSFLGWWELANVAKTEMALAVAHQDDASSLIPFTTRSREEERNNTRAIFQPRARSARYYGRVWNNMQDYAAQKRHMANISGQEEIERGIDSVVKPVRGRKPSVRRSVFKALEPLSDKEVYQALTDMRKHYVEVRVRSERVWQQYMQEQIVPLIKKPATPAWKDALQSGAPAFTAEDLLNILGMIPGVQVPQVNKPKTSNDTELETEQNAEEEAESSTELQAVIEMQNEDAAKQQIVDNIKAQMQEHKF